MAGKRALGKAKIEKNDEFYTQLADIEKEIRHYKHFFQNKVVLCNCDDPYESNFFKYFAMNFNALGLKKLITTCYATSHIIGEDFKYYVNNNGQISFVPSEENIPIQKENKRKPYKVEISEVTDENKDGRIDLSDVEYLMRNKKNTITLLNGNGDFRSPECVELLKEADIVVTNPPFSLFRDYVAQLIEYNKYFLIIGNVNALTYKEIFPLVMNNKVWLGASIHSGDREFRVPDNYPLKAAGYRIDDKGKKYIRVKGVRWFTNIDFDERHENIILYKEYSPDEYPSYYKYDAIEVNKVAKIPYNYNGIMGVPVTFLDKYNPEQFEIIGLGITQSGLSIGIGTNLTDEEMKQFKKDSAAFRKGTLFYLDENGKAKVPFARILIRRKQVNTSEN